jgi:hypothetical protein
VSIISGTIYGQNCNCMQEYKWAKDLFEKNDAGYTFYLKKNGKEAIDANNKKWEKEFAKTKDIFQCLDYLNLWIKFYRKGHIGIGMTDQKKVRPSVVRANNPSSNKIEIPKLIVDIDSFQTVVKSLKEATFEGIWTNETYNIGIKKVKDEYIGFVIASKNEQWKPGQIKFSFPIGKSSTSKSIYYMGDHSIAEKKFDPCNLLGKTYLKAFDIYWKRISPDFGVEVGIETLIKQEKEQLSILNSTSPFIKKIDSSTMMFRIPSFDYNYIPTIDSLTKSNHNLLLNTKNLIIDIRGNGGGSDRCYKSITPYLYTNPIRINWMELFSTPLNNATYNEAINANEFSEQEKQEFRDLQKKLNANIGKFVNTNESNQTFVIDTLPEIYPNPQQVAVIIDERNGSTAEQFILMAKQSKKVKLFGQKTLGALDFSNVNEAISPSKNFKLFYATSRSFRIPKMAIDDYGLQPDYFIDDSIPSNKWIEFVIEVMTTK